MARRTAQIRSLEEHPNLPEVLGVLAQLAHVADDDLAGSPTAGRNTIAVAEARDHALSPDSPLVCEVLAAFEAVQALFADDVRGEAPYLTRRRRRSRSGRSRPSATPSPPPTPARCWPAASTPRCCGRGARCSRPTPPVEEPDLGPRADQVKALLGALPALATRCHDAAGQALYDALVDRSFVEESDRGRGPRRRLPAAVLTSRRRTWALVRRSGAEGLSRPCPHLPHAPRPAPSARTSACSRSASTPPARCSSPTPSPTRSPPG